MRWRRSVVAPVAELVELRPAAGSGRGRVRRNSARTRCPDRRDRSRVRLALPGHEDQGLGDVTAHGGVPALEAVEHAPIGTAGATGSRDHQRLEPRDPPGEHVGLRRAHAGHVVAVAIEDELLDALCAVLDVPVVGEVVGVVGADDAGVRRADGAPRRVLDARQVLELQVTLPVVGRIPSRDRARGPPPCWRGRGFGTRPGAIMRDVAVCVGQHHALHRHDVLAHSVHVVADTADAGVEHAGWDRGVVVGERRPLQRPLRIQTI